MTCYKDGGCGAYEMYSCSECPASKPKYLDRKKPKAKDDYKTIFVVTVFEKCEPMETIVLEKYETSEKWFADIGCTRSPCFRYTFEEAEEVVKYNMCDIWETCDDYAVIQEIGCELYPYPHMKKFYKYNREVNSYEPIKEPECLKHMSFCGIG
jgi:hypothetical protein